MSDAESTKDGKNSDQVSPAEPDIMLDKSEKSAEGPPTTQDISAEDGGSSDQVSPEKPDIMLVTGSREDNIKTFDSARRSTESIDQSYDRQVSGLSTPTKTRGPISMSSTDDEDLGLYSPGDQEPDTANELVEEVFSPRDYLTTERSQANIDIAESAEQWIK